jgi:hypothetical protein
MRARRSWRLVSTMRWSEATHHLRRRTIQLTAEFHDGDAQLFSTIRQVFTIARLSGLDPNSFLACFESARARTLRNNQITRRAAGPAGELGLRNRMPYFLTVLLTLATQEDHTREPDDDEPPRIRRTRDRYPEPPPIDWDAMIARL